MSFITRRLLALGVLAVVPGGTTALPAWVPFCIERPGAREMWVQHTLTSHGKKSLGSEYRRFMAIYRSAGQ